ncbi:MAG TPA: ATP-binding protein [Oligoflexus sp.]|nr:ATP-binding protein [Oligoflexus sp.]HYX39235.1 ATP-binding protein [Oligoflexus sp.]
MRRLRNPYSLSWHLVALVLAAMIPFFIFSAYMVDRLVILERQTSERNLRREAQKLRVSVDQEFKTSIRTLQALGTSASLQRNDLKSFYEDMLRVKDSQPSWEIISVHNSAGQLVMASSREYGEKLPFAPKRNSVLRVIATGQPVVGTIAPAPANSKFANKFAFPVRIPIFAKNKVIYVLSAVVSVELLQTLVMESSGEEEWARTIVDGEGNVAARSRDPETFIGRQGTASFVKRIHESFEGLVREKTLEGKDVYMAFDRSPASGWAVSIPVPVEIVEAPARRSMRIVVVTGILLLVFFGSLALLYSRRLAHRIKSATIGAMALAEGKVPRVERSMVKEVEQLRDSLLTVSNLLQRREQERTEHLEQANAARAEAEQANRAKSEFLANMSHELRTPLGVVLGFSELIADSDTTPEEKAENLEIIKRNGRQLLRLIDDILDLSKVEARRLTIEALDFSLPELISGVLVDLRPQTQDKGLNLTIISGDGVPETVRTDPIRLRQIIYNIVGNAIKFTEQGEVGLHLKADHEHLILIVRDTGIGLTDEQQQFLFRPFTQADGSHTRKYGGTGLGLALCKRLAELLGGDIHLIDSKPGHGSTFQIRVKIK